MPKTWQPSKQILFFFLRIYSKRKKKEFILYLHHLSETKATVRVPLSVLCIVF